MAAMLLKSLAAWTAAGLLLVSLASGSDVVFYERVIHGGRVIDPESGLDAIRDIGLSDGKIAAVSVTPLIGRSAIDARGLVVRPASSTCTPTARTRRTTPCAPPMA